MLKRRFALLAALGLPLLAGAAVAQEMAAPSPGASPPPSATVPLAPRAVLPVKMILMKNGVRRFSVPVTIAGTTIEAGLDTGSVGLRVLPGAVNSQEVKSTSQPSTAHYGSGAQYNGVIADAPLEIAGLKGHTTFQQIQSVGCGFRKPNCPASKISLAEYGIMGDGIAGQGFKAIFGVAAKETELENPFKGVGVTRFVVELPRTEGETGRVILNPDSADLEGFKAVPAYHRIPAQTGLTADTVNGCIEAKKKKICGGLTFDTGMPGIVVASPDDFGKAWSDGTKATMMMDDMDGKPIVTNDVTIGSYEASSKLAFRQMEYMPKTVIRMGIGPYFVFSVLHDLDHGGLAVRPRTTATGAPQ